MTELNPLQKKIIGCLFFTEPFEKLTEETGSPVHILADELKILIDRRLVQVMEEDGSGGHRKSFIYDTDNMNAFCYRATEKGITLYAGSQ